MISPNDNCGLVYFTFQINCFLSNAFLSSIVKSVHIQDFYIFLDNCLLYHYVLPCLSLIIFLILKSTLFDINTATPCFFLVVSTWHIFSNYFAFLKKINLSFRMICYLHRVANITQIIPISLSHNPTDIFYITMVHFRHQYYYFSSNIISLSQDSIQDITFIQSPCLSIVSSGLGWFCSLSLFSL